jgi:uncharacterized membrane protein
MKPAHTLWVSGLFGLIILAVFGFLHPQLPERVAVHWNVYGQVDRYASPLEAIAPQLIALLVLAALTVLLPAISPRRYEIRPFATVFGLIMLMGQAVVLVITLGMLLNAAGHPVRMPLLAALSVGLLFVVLGNYMGKLRKNFFVGIRSPWTLASDEVWARTHRFGGRLFVLAGLLVMVAALSGMPLWVWLAAMLIAVIVPYPYSLLVYRKVSDRN